MNIKDLYSFSFTIIECPIIDIKEYLEKATLDSRIVLNNIDVEILYFHNMYLQPIKGIAKGLFYNPDIASNLTIVLGNGRGSWGSLCNNISVNLLVNNIQIEINTEKSDIFRNSMAVYDGSLKRYTREVQGHLGDNNKMEFVNGGKPLWFENIDYYKRRKIMDRLNKNVLIEYVNKLGIDITDINLFKTCKKSLYVELGS